MGLSGLTIKEDYKFWIDGFNSKHFDSFCARVCAVQGIGILGQVDLSLILAALRQEGIWRCVAWSQGNFFFLAHRRAVRGCAGMGMCGLWLHLVRVVGPRVTRHHSANYWRVPCKLLPVRQSYWLRPMYGKHFHTSRWRFILPQQLIKFLWKVEVRSFPWFMTTRAIMLNF